MEKVTERNLVIKMDIIGKYMKRVFQDKKNQEHFEEVTLINEGSLIQKVVLKKSTLWINYLNNQVEYIVFLNGEALFPKMESKTILNKEMLDIYKTISKIKLPEDIKFKLDYF